ncbi:beta-galactosidase GalA [Marinoscillum sp.]|uniref:beta-galactosidase GalA n=1 Tax=Marinoscillum sp. TaxID=2024838 RepID=UPI003BA93137
MTKGCIKLYFFIFLLVISSELLAQKSPRERINIDNNWRFSLGHAADPAQDFNFKVANIFSKTGKAEETPISPKFNDTNWRLLDLPHDWAVELPFENVDNFDLMAHGYRPVGGLFPENSVGWYRKSLELSRADSGRRLAVTFDGIFRDAMVWLNGFYLGNNESGYMGVTYDITDYVSFDGPNNLVVRVDATQAEGWFYEGAGIYRHVWLQKYDNIHIAEGGQFVYTEVKGNSARVFIETTVENQTLGNTAGQVSSFITDRNGKKVGSTKPAEMILGLNGQATVKQEIVLTDPRLWSLEDPYLYRVTSQVRNGSGVVDQVTTRFGVRTILIDEKKGLSINGKFIKVQGVNCHQDHAGVGSALPDYLQYYRIQLLKEMGVNAYRASHNPPTPELLEACDSLGMLVLDETRLLNSSPEHMGQFERLIKRDRNYPSVFLWCIGNEEGYVQTTSVGKRLALTMLAKQRELDPTRTSTYAADLANVFEGINEVIPVRGFNYREKGMVPYHNDHPDQPVIGTEMGSTVTTRGIYEVDSVKGYVPDQDITHPWWASLAEDWWPIAADNDWLLGGFVWTGFDYRGEPTPFQWPNINSHFGIMDVCGFPKNIYYYYQSWWTDKDVLHISPHWNWAGKEGENIDVWVNSNAEEVELFLNGKTLGKKVMPRNSHLQWQVTYEPGSLKAIATKGGRTYETVMETTGEAHQIVLTPDRNVVTADGKDATVVNVTVLDNKGREVPTANRLVAFSLDGDASIIGVGNGDPSSHEPDKMEVGDYKRSLFNGKCQMILQAGSDPGKVVINATSAGLKSATVSIQLVKTKNNLLGKR